MIQEQYKNFLITLDYKDNGGTHFLVWKLDKEQNPYDLWGEGFQSIRQAKTFINGESQNGL